jgi:hypothetical protein
MTLRTMTTLKCVCGYTGVLRTSENDQPYSAEWVSHKLEGFGGTVSDLGGTDEVQCPNCGQIGQIKKERAGYRDDRAT